VADDKNEKGDMNEGVDEGGNNSARGICGICP
jgi:hypothetical protein